MNGWIKGRNKLENTREGRMGEERREVTIEGYGKMNYGWKEEKGEE